MVAVRNFRSSAAEAGYTPLLTGDSQLRNITFLSTQRLISSKHFLFWGNKFREIDQDKLRSGWEYNESYGYQCYDTCCPVHVQDQTDLSE